VNRSKLGLGLRQASTFVTLIGSLISGPAVAAVSGKTDVRTSHLRCDYLTEPLGLDDLHPRLSWQMESARPGAAQTAYQIAVASSPEMLRRNHPDMWDSGRVASGISVDIPYAGAPLLPGKRNYWSTRVWDERGAAVTASQPSWWEMGLLTALDWKAKWISSDTAEDREDRASAPRWIWTAGEDALKHPKEGKHQFRFDFDLEQRPAEATLLITGKDTVSAAVNGKQVLEAAPAPPWGSLYTWGTFGKLDVTSDLLVGKNLLAAEANVVSPGQNGSAGLIALLRLKMPDGKVKRYVSDSTWKSVDAAQGSWRAADYDDSRWKETAVAAQLGDDPLGTPWPPKPASLFRRGQISKSIRSARLYVTALGSYEMRLNGDQIGKEVLAPGCQGLAKRVAPGPMRRVARDDADLFRAAREIRDSTFRCGASNPWPNTRSTACASRSAPAVRC